MTKTAGSNPTAVGGRELREFVHSVNVDRPLLEMPGPSRNSHVIVELGTNGGLGPNVGS